VQAETAPVVAVAVVVCSLLAAVFVMRQAADAGPQEQAEQQNADI
jgi:hypothetical protein